MTEQYVVIEFSKKETDEINKLVEANDFDGLLAHPHEITSDYPVGKGFHPQGYQVIKPFDGILWRKRTFSKVQVKDDFGNPMIMLMRVVKMPFDFTPDFAICFRIS